ncbi:hypothetical protein IV203_017829 [Nitzschia inconspicua]|uniref:Transmembrane protein n=1 Tax=Nitzschia inconspicua TaxID=303405 RepID=A0A9K3M139_9STRA|nr:hypothetical protein IV203_020530 [Nitzschia inconspicua]KAG7371688.1 hypothetical protein IV203_017829 [Nitzschia inconspicua]
MFKRPAPVVNKSLDEEHQNSRIVRDLEAPFLERSSSTMGSTGSIASNKDDDDDNDEDASSNNNTTVIHARCNVLSKSYFFGIMVGIFLQAVSFYASNFIKSAYIHNVVAAFVLYVFTKYWMPIALLFPAVVVALRSRSLPGHLRLESFFESLRFQFGLFFGSLLLLSLVNFYALANTAPLPLLMAYYAVCSVVSFVALCLLQIFINEVCANISSIEVIINYEDTGAGSNKKSTSDDA